MFRRTFIALIGAAGSWLVTNRLAAAQVNAGDATPVVEGETMPRSASQSGYAPVNGLQLYYEIHGAGEPLLLIHGAFATIDKWGPTLSSLAENHRVIAVELQGHGHTADIDRPLRYESLADDLAALLEYLEIPQADVVGYSLGGTTGLQLAIRHPERVRKLVAISANYRSDGYYPEILAGIDQITPEVFAGSPMEASYLASAPNPADWPVLIERLKELDSQEFAWPEADIQGISAPVLLIYGDSDAVRPEHAVELFRLLGGGVPGDLTGLPPSQLAILPGKTHVSLVTDQTDLWLSMIEAFLSASAPAAG